MTYNVSHLYFVPKIPLPVIHDDEYYNEGDFLFFSKAPRLFIDFQVNETYRIHISDQMRIQLSDEDYNTLFNAARASINALSYRVSYQQFESHNCFFLPAMRHRDQTVFESTLEWAKSYISPKPISVLYQQVMTKYNKRSQGRDLMKYIYENGEKIDEFFSFLSRLPTTIQDFLDKEEEKRESILNDAQFVAALVACCKFTSSIVERNGLTKYRGEKYQIIIRANFNQYVKSMMDPPGNISYKDYYKSKYNITDLSDYYPMIETIPPKKQHEFENSLYEQLTQFPNAYNIFHFNLKYILANDPRKTIDEIYKRMSNSIEIENNPRIPQDILFFTPYPRQTLPFQHHINRIIEQMIPITAGDKPLSEKIIDAFRTISKKTQHRFKNWFILAEALTDPTYKHTQSEYIQTYQRLEYLGDAVIDLIVGFAAYNGNPEANEGLMSQLKVAMVKNQTFAHVAYAFELSNYVVTQRRDNYTPESKSTADLFESLFGAIFVDSNLNECFRVFALIVDNYKDQFIENVKHKLAKNTIKYIIEHKDTLFNTLIPPRDFTQEWTSKIDLNELSQAIGYTVDEENMLPFIVALTHKSFDKRNYERLEFIGDIIVKFALISAQFIAFPNADEAGMSIASAELKSNAILGRCTYSMGLQRMLLCDSSIEEELLAVTDENVNSKTYPLNKIFGDTFEAITAAIACTYGLAEACNFVTNNVIGDKWINDADYPNLQPKAEMIQMLQKQYKIHPSFQLWVHGPQYITACDLDKVRVPIIGESSEQNMSEQILANRYLYEQDSYNEQITQLLNESDEKTVSQEPFFVTFE